MASSALSRHGGVGAEAETFRAIVAFERVCAESDLPLMRAAVAWLLWQPAVASVIMGCSSVAQVKE